MSTNKLIFTILGSFLSGIFIRSFYVVPAFLLYGGLVVACALLGAVLVQKSKLTQLLLVSIALFGFSIGILRFEYADNRLDTLRDFVGVSTTFSGIIIEEADYREKTTRLIVSIDGVEGGKKVVSEKVLLTTLPPNRYQYGERVVVTGTLKKPENFETITGRIFDYRSYLAKQDIFYEMSFPHITVVGEGQGNKVKELLFTVKQKFLDDLNTVISAPESSLLGGILLGGSQSLSEELQQDFRNAGLVHIIVLSGYNITIVATAFMFLFSFLGIRKRIVFGILGIFLFSIMTGGSATVVRASVMATLALIATFIRRDYDITRALIIAGVSMVFINPRILVFDISFQLSFLSTIGLIYVSPLCERYTSFITTRFGIRDIVVATLATQLFVLPFILYSIGTFSVVALIANLLVLPLIPVTMLLGFITGVAAFLSGSIASPFAYLTYWLLHYEILVAGKLGNLPFASFVVPQFPAWIMFLIYLSLGYLLWFMQKKNAPDVAGALHR